LLSVGFNLQSFLSFHVKFCGQPFLFRFFRVATVIVSQPLLLIIGGYPLYFCFSPLHVTLEFFHSLQVFSFYTLVVLVQGTHRQFGKFLTLLESRQLLRVFPILFTELELRSFLPRNFSLLLGQYFMMPFQVSTLLPCSPLKKPIGFHLFVCSSHFSVSERLFQMANFGRGFICQCFHIGSSSCLCARYFGSRIFSNSLHFLLLGTDCFSCL
jgi:hypothetical protein